MNIAYFLTPKSSVAYLYEDYSFRQGLEKMRRQGYSAIPVISRDGRYVGFVREGDFLWRLFDATPEDSSQGISLRDLERLKVRDIVIRSRPPVPITVSMEELLSSATTQNFVSVVDDLGSFIGIVTRKDIIRYFQEHPAPAENPRNVEKPT